MPGLDLAFLDRLLDSMASGLIAIDREGTIRVFNEAAARLRIHRVKLHEKIRRYGIAGTSTPNK